MKSFILNHYFRYNTLVGLTVLYFLSMPLMNATQLTTVEIVDKGVILVSFKDGDIIFRDDAKGPSAYLSVNDPTENSTVLYGNPFKEADFINTRPSRRGTDNEINYYHTGQNMQRTLIAHAITKGAKEKDFFLRALTTEADWGLGRNSLNFIQMGTATTPLADKRSVEKGKMALYGYLYAVDKK